MTQKPHLPTNSELINEITDFKLEYHEKIATLLIDFLQSQGISLSDFVRGIGDYCYKHQIESATLLLEEASRKIRQISVDARS
jgi:hypothetical protein